MMRYVVTHDIADGSRREDVASLWSAYGPRVQLSVFECALRTPREAALPGFRLRDLIETLEDQARLCSPDNHAPRQDLWVVA
jgi:CRISPR-associated protein Cas2